VIDRKRVEQLAQQKTGLDALEAFLDRVRPDVRAMEEMESKIKAMFKDTPDPVERIAIIGVAVDWFRLHEDDYHRLHARAVEALRLAEHHRVIANGRITTRRNRKASARHRALIHQLEDTQETLADFVATYPRAMAWIQDVLPTLLPNLRYGLGCMVIHVSP
jgi:hypothetical protein